MNVVSKLQYFRYREEGDSTKGEWTNAFAGWFWVCEGRIKGKFVLPWINLRCEQRLSTISGNNTDDAKQTTPTQINSLNAVTRDLKTRTSRGFPCRHLLWTSWKSGATGLFSPEEVRIGQRVKKGLAERRHGGGGGGGGSQRRDRVTRPFLNYFLSWG